MNEIAKSLGQQLANYLDAVEEIVFTRVMERIRSAFFPAATTSEKISKPPLGDGPAIPPTLFRGDNVTICPECRERTFRLVNILKTSESTEEIRHCTNKLCNYKGKE